MLNHYLSLNKTNKKNDWLNKRKSYSNLYDLFIMYA